MERLKQGIDSAFQKKEVPLNDFISAEIMESGDLWIHVQSRHDQRLSDKLRLLREGFFKLASLLKTDERLAGIQRIVGSSWIVSEHPKILRELGFDIAESGEGFEHLEEEYSHRKKGRDAYFEIKPHAHAYMDKERFIELYGD